jgi:hypothetical protein
MEFRVTVAALGLAIVGLSSALGADQLQAPSPITVIPFELTGSQIFVSATVNGSRPLAFQFDTGVNQTLIHVDIADELKLKKKADVLVGGVGAGGLVGSLLRDATWSLVGLQRFTQPVTYSLPLRGLSAAVGRDIDGAIGGEFIRRYVVTVDYQAKTLTLYDSKTFVYQGGGESLPIEFTPQNQPVLSAILTPAGGPPLACRFIVDLGSTDALILHSPFVAQERLLDRGMKTIRSIGQTGVGGTTTGEIGRVASVQLGSFALKNVITMFAKDKAGMLADASLAGNIGSQIARRFRVTLDYRAKRIILEPTPRLTDPYDPAFSGLALLAEAPNYRVFRVTELLEDSPAIDAGIRVGDVITAIDGTAASALTLSDVREMFQKPVSYLLSLRRGSVSLMATLTPRRLIES